MIQPLHLLQVVFIADTDISTSINDIFITIQTSRFWLSHCDKRKHSDSGYYYYYRYCEVSETSGK